MEYALAIQATHNSAAEVHTMPDSDRYLTALLQARYLKEVYGGSGGNSPNA